VKTSRLLWPGFAQASPLHAHAVVLATGASFPDALAGGPLAHAAMGPLLLTDPGSLTPETFDEIKRVLPIGGTVYVLGGTSAVSPAVADQLASYGYIVTRLGGTDRFATARLIADEVERLVPTPAGQSEAFVLATGQNFADALSAGPLAAIGDMPILLTDGSELDAATRDYLSGKLVLPVGGPAYEAAGVPADPSQPCGDLAGADRFATSAAVAHCIADVRSAAGVPAPVFTGIATGTNYADALTGGAFLGMLGDPLLLTDPQSLSGPAADFLGSERQTVRIVEIFGGPNAVSTGVESSILTLLGARHLPSLSAPAGQAAPPAAIGPALGISTRPLSAPKLRAAAAPVR
jgi:putative cell wall-binding protein